MKFITFYIASFLIPTLVLIYLLRKIKREYNKIKILRKELEKCQANYKHL